MDTALNIKNRNPPNTMYCNPIPDINNPHIVVPIVVPRFADVKNSPLANSGASGAADVIQYWFKFPPTPANIPHSTYN